MESNVRRDGANELGSLSFFFLLQAILFSEAVVLPRDVRQSLRTLCWLDTRISYLVCRVHAFSFQNEIGRCTVAMVIDLSKCNTQV